MIRRYLREHLPLAYLWSRSVTAILGSIKETEF